MFDNDDEAINDNSPRFAPCDASHAGEIAELIDQEKLLAGTAAYRVALRSVEVGSDGLSAVERLDYSKLVDPLLTQARGDLLGVCGFAIGLMFDTNLKRGVALLTKLKLPVRPHTLEYVSKLSSSDEGRS